MGNGRRAPVVLGMALATLGVAAEAHAASVAVGPDEIELGGPPVLFEAAAGEPNDLAVTSVEGDPDAVVFSDSGASISPGEGCTARADGSVLCSVEGLAGVMVRLEDGDDRLDAAGLRDQRPPPRPSASNFFAFEAEGGDGADEMVGADATFACLRGEAGNDVLTSALSASAPRRAECGPIGGPGEDWLIGTRRPEVFVGGDDPDLILAGGGDDGVGGGAGGDRIELGSGADFAQDGTGDDLVLAGPGADELEDKLGADRLLGEAGHDRFSLDFRAAEGADAVRGGEGRDQATYLCPSCRLTLNARGDDGERGASGDNLVQIEKLTAESTRFDVSAEQNAAVGPGDDVLIGNHAPNVLDSGRGADLLAGAAGRDRLLAGGGPDLVRAAEGAPDRVRCGGGRDHAVVDGRDRVKGCEQVRVLGRDIR